MRPTKAVSLLDTSRINRQLAFCELRTVYFRAVFLQRPNKDIDSHVISDVGLIINLNGVSPGGTFQVYNLKHVQILAYFRIKICTEKFSHPKGARRKGPLNTPL